MAIRIFLDLAQNRLTTIYAYGLISYATERTLITVVLLHDGVLRHTAAHDVYGTYLFNSRVSSRTRLARR